MGAQPKQKGYRDLSLLVAGNAVSALGNSVYLIAVMLLLKSLTGSAFVLGLFQFVALAPGFLLSPITGAVIDRYSRRSIIIAADLMRGVVMVGAGIALMAPALKTPWFILPISFVAGIGHALFVPAVQALLPSIVPPERLHTATGARAATSQIANLSGNAIGGSLYAVVGAPLVFVFNGLSFLVSAIQERFIRPDTPPVLDGSTPGTILRNAHQGFATTMNNRSLRILIVSQAGLFVLSPVLMLSLPFIVLDELSMSESAVGLFFAAAIGGGIAAFAALRRLSAPQMLGLPLVGFAYLGFGLAFVGVSVTAVPLMLVLVAIASGAAAATVYMYTTTWIQLRWEPSMHGRLFATYEAANALVAPMSYLVIGGLIDIAGPAHRWMLFAASGIIAAAWGLFVFLSPTSPI